MPLLRGIARTAVVAGTATAVSNRVSRRQAGRWAAKDDQQQYEQQQQQQQQYAPPAQAAPPPPPQQNDTDRMLSQLRELGELHTSGVIDDAEFELQKSKILKSA
jgi:hypothetical protein